jgi:hypothetical protein
MPRPLLNYGERLYQKGIKQKEELIRQGREAKAKEEQQQIDSFSFKPRINMVSK